MRKRAAPIGALSHVVLSLPPCGAARRRDNRRDCPAWPCRRRADPERRAALDRIGGDEAGFLNVLQEIAESGKCPAEEKLDLYNGRWNRSVDPVFTEFAY